jgi:hypothetical protein
MKVAKVQNAEMMHGFKHGNSCMILYSILTSQNHCTTTISITKVPNISQLQYMKFHQAQAIMYVKLGMFKIKRINETVISQIKNTAPSEHNNIVGEVRTITPAGNPELAHGDQRCCFLFQVIPGKFG